RLPAMTNRSIFGCLVALGLASAMLVATARSEEIKIVSTGAFKEVLGELALAYERSSGHKLTVAFAGTDEIVARLGSGEAIDIVIAPAPWIDDLTKRGLLVAGSRADIARSGIGAAARLGAPWFDISSSGALKKSLLEAERIVLSTGVSGIYLTKLFATWGV